MSIDLYFKRICIPDVHDFFNCIGNAVNRDNYVIRQKDFADQLDRSLAITSHVPNAIVRFKNINGTRLFANVGYLFHLFIRIVCVIRFNRYDDIYAFFITGHIFISAIIGTAANIWVIHIFNTRRLNAGFNQLRYHVQSRSRRVIDGQDVKTIRRQRRELHCNFRNNTESSFAADN